jgi:hypothetical protein
MTVAVVPFTPETLPLVARFSEKYWDRPRTEEYYRWRYLESLAFSVMYLAVCDRECVGSLFALRKNYSVRGAATRCLEVFDWHVFPDAKGTGVGVRLMRAMMKHPERIVAFGGTADVVSALPAMGWEKIAGAGVFELPISGGFLAAGVERRTGFPRRVATLPMGLLAMAWYRGVRVHRFPTGRVWAASMTDEAVDALYQGETGYDFIQNPNREILRWLSCGFGGNGSFRFLVFTIAGRVRGWSLARLYETTQGREAAILEVFAPKPDVGLYTWMVGETTRYVVGTASPQVVRARATCPVLGAALRANRFRASTLETPVFSWPKGLGCERVHVTLNHSDEPIRPYMSHLLRAENGTREGA